MTNNELLVSISQLMDEKIEPLRKDMTHEFNEKFEKLDRKIDSKIEALDRKIDSKIEALDRKIDSKIEVLDRKIDGKIEELDNKIDGKVNALENKFDNKFDELKREIVAIKIDIENDIKPNICKLAENYLPAAKRFDREADKIEMLEMRMGLAEKVIMRHSERIMG